MRPHPASPPRASLVTYLWRYFTGHHLDGRQRTNATWTRRATAPSHHMNWWSSKPRFHRMAWRWGMIAVPAGWLTAYAFAPTYGINLVVIITLAFLPYLFHHGVTTVIRLLPRNTVVYVTDNFIHPSLVDTEQDDTIIPEMLPQNDDIQDSLDLAVSQADESYRHATQRKTRRS